MQSANAARGSALFIKKAVFFIAFMLVSTAAFFCFSDPCDLGIEDVSIPIGKDVFQYPVGLHISDSPTSGPPLREPNMTWVEDTMSSMTLDEKIGQLIISSQHSSGESLIDNYKVGGFIFLGNGQNAGNIVNSVNRLQEYSPFPLWFAIDSEAGLGARVANATIFPLIMASGAADDPALTELCGRITARESRALGIQIGFGPVVDVNTEPVNPIISTRSYSDDPDRVARLAEGYIAGARAEGILCTFKHYPGHGATTGDSHSSLPTVNLTSETLHSDHIKPYRDLASTGNIDFVMSAHVWYPAFDPGTPWPATLSTVCLKDILRTDIGYNGVIISDSYGMAGLAVAVPDEQERAVVGLEAGLDIILNPPNVGNAFNGIKNAVISERLTMDRIDESVRRVLIAKSRVGLPEATTVTATLYPTVLQHPEHLQAVRDLSEKSFTCGKYMLASSPAVPPSSHALVLTLTATKTIFYCFSATYFTSPFVAAVPNTTVRSVSASVSTTERNQILAQAEEHDIIVVAGYDWYKIMPQSQVDLINDLCDLTKPVIYVSFGAPYHYLQIPDVDAFYCGYASVPQMQDVAVEVLVGEREPIGNLPVHVEGLPAFLSVKDWKRIGR
ncbi:hypothetical protein JW926_05505 [Candidatus Sumerlaeota bacterium]|nr:hypothetical protein [Candidatus Sumerlaeota bacterium]